MRKHLYKLLAFVIICSAMASCKLDPPILPGNPNYVPYAPPGTETGTGTGTGNSGTTSSTALTGTWVASASYIISYDQSKNIISNLPFPVQFVNKVIINDAAKTAEFPSDIGSSLNTTYVSSVVGGTLQAVFSTQPFSLLTDNTIPVKITNLTATSMTWTSTDPAGISSGGLTFYTAYRTVFTKQ